MSNSMENIICFGEMLWDILPNGKQVGGGPFNVAVHLQNLGLNPTLISKVGNDDLGKELLDFVKESNLDTKYIQQGNTHLTGVAKANVNDVHEVIYKIVQPVAWDYIQLNSELKDLVQDSDILIYGSLSTRQEPSESTLLDLLNLANFKIFDVNLRPPHYTTTKVSRLLDLANMVKLNHHELAEITSWFSKFIKIKDQMKFLRDLFDLEIICVSLGEKGACLLVGDEYYTHPAFQIQVVDTIGSGDAFLATFVGQMVTHQPFQEALKTACAAGALVATYQGAIPDLSLDKIKEFIRASS